MKQSTFYTCGADTTYDRNGVEYVCDHMGQFDTAEEAARYNAGLHPSFGYAILRVEVATVKGLKRVNGFRRGSACCGHRIVERCKRAYEYPEFHEALSERAF